MEQGPHRRDFLELCFRFSAGISILAGLIPLERYLGWESPETESDLKPLSLGKVSEFPAGQARAAHFHGKPVWVFNQSGKFKAYFASCTHLGCPVQWKEKDSRFHCPCHGAQFDSGGQPISGPAKRGLREIVTAERDGELFLQ